MTARDGYARTLLALPEEEWEPYLAAHSGLPGPRGNLELLAAVGDLASADDLRRWATSADEYLAACGTAGLGRLLVEGDDVEPLLRTLAADARWRVREAVAMALQRLGDADLDRLLRLTEAWADRGPLVQRAAVAGLCEPRLLRTDTGSRAALRLVDRVTAALAAVPSARRRDDEVRTLRKALGYCWSVAVAAAPATGFPLLAGWASSDDADVRWVVRQNTTKARLVRADAEWAGRIRDLVTPG